MGGALRFLTELDGYLDRHPGAAQLIGRNRQLDTRWVVEREIRAARSQHVVALNNVSFVWVGAYKTALLRNALHFLSVRELAAIPVTSRVKLQGRMVRAAMTRADRIIVPTSSMANRVISAHPAIADRIVVVPHPLSMPESIELQDEWVFLCPVLDAPYKMLATRLGSVIEALRELRQQSSCRQFQLHLTLTPREAGSLNLDRPTWVRLLGRLSPDELHKAQRHAMAIIYPTTLESFGYPLAEARLARQFVVAPLTDHAREVAGEVLVGYNPASAVSLLDALQECLERPRPQALEQNPFEPEGYFGRLFTHD